MLLTKFLDLLRLNSFHTYLFLNDFFVVVTDILVEIQNLLSHAHSIFNAWVVFNLWLQFIPNWLQGLGSLNLVTGQVFGIEYLVHILVVQVFFLLFVSCRTAYLLVLLRWLVYLFHDFEDFVHNQIQLLVVIHGNFLDEGIEGANSLVDIDFILILRILVLGCCTFFFLFFIGGLDDSYSFMKD